MAKVLEDHYDSFDFPGPKEYFGKLQIHVKTESGSSHEDALGVEPATPRSHVPELEPLDV